MPAAARADPKIARPMPASPQNSSSAAIGRLRPVWSPIIVCTTKSTPYSPMRAASSTIGHGYSSRSSHSSAAGRTTFSAKSWTHFCSCRWSSLSASEKSAIPECYPWVTPGRNSLCRAPPLAPGSGDETDRDGHEDGADDVGHPHAGPPEQEPSRGGTDDAREAAGRLLQPERLPAPLPRHPPRDGG